MNVARARSRLFLSSCHGEGRKGRRAYQKGTASPKSPPHFANVSITSGVMILEVESVIADSSTSTGRSLLASARIRLTSSAYQPLIYFVYADTDW